MLRDLFRVMSALSLVYVCATLGLPSASRADDFATDELILKLGDGGDIDLINAAWGTVAIDSIPSRGIYLLRLTNPAIQDSMAVALDGVPESAFCDYDYEGQSPEARRQIVIVAIGVTGTDVEDQGAMARVRKDEAHAIATGAGTRVAVLDTGVELDHPFLAGRINTSLARDFVDDDADASEERDGIDNNGDGVTDGGAGHGTMVAGIIATIAPDAEIVPIRILDDEGRGTMFRVIEGLYYAHDIGANIVNASFGSQNDTDALEAALDELELSGITVVAAVGNDSINDTQYPAKEGGSFAITSADSLDVKADFANYSTETDLSAPGVGVLSSYLDGGFGLGVGTSFSAPFVAGTVALLREIFTSDSPDLFQAWVEQGSVNIDWIPANQPWAGNLGAGRLDCVGALNAMLTSTGVEPHSPPAPGAAIVSLLPSAPNPARDVVRFRFNLGAAFDARLEIYSAEGRRVTQRELGVLASGAHAIETRMTEASGAPLPSGRYLYRIVTPAESQSGQFLLVR